MKEFLPHMYMEKMGVPDASITNDEEYAKRKAQASLITYIRNAHEDVNSVGVNFELLREPLFEKLKEGKHTQIIEIEEGKTIRIESDCVKNTTQENLLHINSLVFSFSQKDKDSGREVQTEIRIPEDITGVPQVFINSPIDLVKSKKGLDNEIKASTKHSSKVVLVKTGAPLHTQLGLFQLLHELNHAAFSENKSKEEIDRRITGYTFFQRRAFSLMTDLQKADVIEEERMVDALSLKKMKEILKYFGKPTEEVRKLAHFYLANYAIALGYQLDPQEEY